MNTHQPRHIIPISILPIIAITATIALSGCLSLHADLPERMVRHIAREDGVELPAICTHEGQIFSEGAVVCMTDRRMICDSTERWVQDDSC
jgi:hypothetical protein